MARVHPVAVGGGLVEDDGILLQATGAFSGATVEAARHRGLRRAVTAVIANDALRHGASDVVRQASPTGAPLHRSMGFSELCRCGTFVRWPEAG